MQSFSIPSLLMCSSRKGISIAANVLYICVSAGVKTTMPNCLSRLVEPQNFKVCNLARIAQIYCYGIGCPIRWFPPFKWADWKNKVDNHKPTEQ